MKTGAGEKVIMKKLLLRSEQSDNLHELRKNKICVVQKRYTI